MLLLQCNLVFIVHLKQFDQALGNIIGAILSVTMVTIFSDNFIIMGVTVLVLIAILFKFNLAHVATLASVTALIIMGQHTGSFILLPFTGLYL